jgi:hypothetical protein
MATAMQAATEEKSTSEATPDGPIWAGVLAAGIGCAALGGLVDATEASKAVSKALTFYTPTGDLSGKTVVAIVIWLAAWAILHGMWRHRNIRSRGAILAVTLILIVLAIVAVFPPFFGLFAAG